MVARHTLDRESLCEGFLSAGTENCRVVCAPLRLSRSAAAGAQLPQHMPAHAIMNRDREIATQEWEERRFAYLFMLRQ
jgi:hypothetical protein